MSGVKVVLMCLVSATMQGRNRILKTRGHKFDVLCNVIVV